MTDALVAFLKARLEDDAQVARAATGTEWGDVDPQQPYAIWDVKARQKNRTLEHVGRLASVASPEDRAHIARQDPARTLREVEAARAVIGLYEETGNCMDRAMRDGDTGAYQEARIEQRTLRKALLHEAAVHEAHPDYLEEWRP